MLVQQKPVLAADGSCICLDRLGTTAVHRSEYEVRALLRGAVTPRQSRAAARVDALLKSTKRQPSQELRDHSVTGRDVYAYTAGARAAYHVRQVASNCPRVVTIPQSRRSRTRRLRQYPTDDGNYGNIWTNVDRATFVKLGAAIGDQVKIRILKGGEEVLNLTVSYVTTFGGVEVGKPLLYMNSLDSVSLAINQESFAGKYGVKSGPAWSIPIRVDRAFSAP